MDGRVLQVNVSPGGVPKLPVERAWVGRLGVEGDRQNHDTVHGGPHRAVALLAIEAIERVRAEGHPIEAGSVGENLTTTGIELARLAVGTRLAIGEGLVLELSGPANPCDVIAGSFRNGKSGRISILTHPSDSRMYARTITEGEVRSGDPIRIMQPAPDTQAATHHALDLLDSVERDAWLAMWRAAADVGYDVRVLERGDAAAAACAELPGSVFNRAFGLRQIPAILPSLLDLYREAGTPGWLVAGVDDPPLPGAVGERPVGVHVGAIGDVPDATVDGLDIRPIEPGEERRWAELFIAGFGIDGPLAEAWLRFEPVLAGARGYHQVIARQAGREIGAAATFTRRRVAWLGAGTVLPEARGQGIQRALIAYRARAAETIGCRQIMATAELDDPSARNLTAMGMPLIWSRAHYRFDPAV
jgi:MOSC domain-containing protein YiiM/GNAT superfamily N-acetyltransferase